MKNSVFSITSSRRIGDRVPGDLGVQQLERRVVGGRVADVFRRWPRRTSGSQQEVDDTSRRLPCSSRPPGMTAASTNRLVPSLRTRNRPGRGCPPIIVIASPGVVGGDGRLAADHLVEDLVHDVGLHQQLLVLEGFGRLAQLFLARRGSSNSPSLFSAMRERVARVVEHQDFAESTSRPTADPSCPSILLVDHRGCCRSCRPSPRCRGPSTCSPGS